MKKGFIQVAAIIGVLAIVSVLLINGNSLLNLMSDEIGDVNERVDLIEQGDIMLGGSLVATKYGGLGTSSASWTGLVRTTAGIWGTTTLTDADVPDTITVTNLPNEVNFTTSSIAYLAATTTVFKMLSVSGTSTFGATSTFSAGVIFSNIPTMPTSTATTATNVASVYYVNNHTPDHTSGAFEYTLDTGTSTIAHGLGRVPNYIKIFATTNAGSGVCAGTYDGASTKSVYDGLDTGGSYSSTYICYLSTTANGNAHATTTFNSVNINFNWTVTDTPAGTGEILWEAY